MNPNLPHMVLPSIRDEQSMAPNDFDTDDGWVRTGLEEFYRKMDNAGLVVLRNALDKELCTRVRTVGSSSKNWTDLFNPDETETGGVKHKKARLFRAITTDGTSGRQGKGQGWPKLTSKASSWNGHVLRNMFTRVGNLARRFVSPRHVAKQAVFLKSGDPKTSRQYVHRDYHDNICTGRKNYTKARSSSYGIIVALQGGTKFVYWPGSHKEEGVCGGKLGHVNAAEAASATLNAGDVLFFKDTLAHAGAEYDTPNIRMHFYCDDIVDDETCRSIDTKNAGTVLPAKNAKKNDDVRQICQFEKNGETTGCVAAGVVKRGFVKKCVVRRPNDSDKDVVEVFAVNKYGIGHEKWNNMCVVEEGEKLYVIAKAGGKEAREGCRKVDRVLYNAFLNEWKGEDYQHNHNPKHTEITLHNTQDYPEEGDDSSDGGSSGSDDDSSDDSDDSDDSDGQNIAV